jgi:hypothetical protein
MSKQTEVVQAADFFYCKGMRDSIVGYFQKLLLESIEQSASNLSAQSASTDVGLAMALHQAYTHDWHKTLVRPAYTKHLIQTWGSTPCANADMHDAFGEPIWRSASNALVTIVQIQIPRKKSNYN